MCPMHPIEHSQDEALVPFPVRAIVPNVQYKGIGVVGTILKYLFWHEGWAVVFNLGRNKRISPNEKI